MNRLDVDGTPFFYNDTNEPDASANGNCYSLYSLTPITRCTNETIPDSSEFIHFLYVMINYL